MAGVRRPDLGVAPRGPAAHRGAEPRVHAQPQRDPLTVSPDEISVVVANGSGATGLAGQEAEALRVQGFANVTTDNAEYREGTLVETADGWAIVVDRGETPSWLLTLSGVSEAAARRIAADLLEVDA